MFLLNNSTVYYSSELIFLVLINHFLLYITKKRHIIACPNY